MAVRTQRLSFPTEGNGHLVDVTRPVQEAVAKAGLKDGLVAVFVTGSTAGVTTIENEPGLLLDMAEAVERLAPQGRPYHHNETAGDDNGHSHVRASLIGPGITVPFSSGRLALGTWQQIVVIDFDTHPRRREVVLQIVGE